MGIRRELPGNTRVFYVHRAGQESRTPASNNPGIHSPGHRHNVRHVGRLCIQAMGYAHLTVNHTYEFVDPITGAHTQNVENPWKNAEWKKAEWNTSLNAGQLPL